MRRCFLVAALAMAAPAAGTMAWADSLVVTPVAVAGERSPAGGSYFLFGDISIDTLKRTTFAASVINGRGGIFQTSRGEIVPLVLQGDPAPPEAGSFFLAFFEGAANRHGDFAFIATTLPSGRPGVFKGSGGVITSVALAGDLAPTRFGESFIDFDQLYILDSGDIYFGGGLFGSERLESRAVFRASSEGLEAVVTPGDHFDFIREVVEALQFDVNQSGELAILTATTEFENLEPSITFEMLRLSEGRLTSLAAAGAPIGRNDFLRSFAATFDQTNIDESGTLSFFGSTDALPLGGYFENPLNVPRDNRKLVAQGDPSPVSPADRFLAFGSFARNELGTIAFAATTREVPGGGFYVQRGGEDFIVAQIGEPRPDGGDVWHGFLRADMGPEDSFIFTDRQGVALVGIFSGRFLPPPAVLVERLQDILDSAALNGESVAGLTRQVTAIGRAVDREDLASALRLSLALRTEIDQRAGRSVSTSTADELASRLEDLILALGGEPGHPAKPGGGPPRTTRQIHVR
ncbi:MAG TPA: hypothetical protein VFG76_11705 [Candidatus Polarisedimenticolia bacterium]|nr:hypothetical protein [Candidatus Polarisedimenticolia bacterium]